MKKLALLTTALTVAVSVCKPVVCQTAYHPPVETPDLAKPDTALKKTYEREAIYLNGNMTNTPRTTSAKRIGLLGRSLKKEFDNCSEESKNEVAVALKKKRRGTILVTASGVVLMALIVAPVGFIVGPAIASAVIMGAGGATVASYIVGTVNVLQGQNRLNKAVWLHNRDIVAQ